MKLKITVRQNINQLFDDLDNDDADMLAAGLVYNSERSKNYQPGPTYYSVSQQLVYRVGSLRPRSLASINDRQLTIAPGHVVIDYLRELKEKKYPDLSWTVDPKLYMMKLLEQVKIRRCPTPSPIRSRSACSSGCILKSPWRWTSPTNSP